MLIVKMLFFMLLSLKNNSMGKNNSSSRSHNHHVLKQSTRMKRNMALWGSKHKIALLVVTKMQASIVLANAVTFWNLNHIQMLCSRVLQSSAKLPVPQFSDIDRNDMKSVQQGSIQIPTVVKKATFILSFKGRRLLLQIPLGPSQDQHQRYSRMRSGKNFGLPIQDQASLVSKEGLNETGFSSYLCKSDSVEQGTGVVADADHTCSATMYVISFEDKIHVNDETLTKKAPGKMSEEPKAPEKVEKQSNYHFIHDSLLRDDSDQSKMTARTEVNISRFDKMEEVGGYKSPGTGQPSPCQRGCDAAVQYLENPRLLDDYEQCEVESTLKKFWKQYPNVVRESVVKSLLQGINMPAKTVVSASLSKRRDSGHSLLSSNTLLQMVGRAGASQESVHTDAHGGKLSGDLGLYGDHNPNFRQDSDSASEKQTCRSVWTWKIVKAKDIGGIKVVIDLDSKKQSRPCGVCSPCLAQIIGKSSNVKETISIGSLHLEDYCNELAGLIPDEKSVHLLDLALSVAIVNTVKCLRELMEEMKRLWQTLKTLSEAEK
eukprot:Gb_05203 [translate_table: standard]